MSLTDWTRLVALAVLWSGAFFFSAYALREVPPLSIALARAVIAAAVLIGTAQLVGIGMPREPRVWLAFAGMGLINNAIPHGLIFWGQTHIPSGLASILNATSPLFGAVIAHVATRDEKLTGAKVAGLLFGLAGVAVLIGGQAFEGADAALAAEIACLGAALSYGVAAVFARRFRGMGVTPWAVAAGQVIMSSVILFPVAMIVDRPWTLPMPGVDTMAALLCLGVFTTALGFILYFRILASAGATNALLVTLLIPVGAVLLGVLALGETLAARHFGGMALIGVGLLVLDGRLARLARRDDPRPSTCAKVSP
ncbi:MAG: DMT family transporter [Alphaproteobacteria bacterium]|nr:DMT family transporter [Alphaproteobacteria bacterium]